MNKYAPCWNCGSEKVVFTGGHIRIALCGGCRVRLLTPEQSDVLKQVSENEGIEGAEGMLGLYNKGLRQQHPTVPDPEPNVDSDTPCHKGGDHLLDWDTGLCVYCGCSQATLS